MKTISGIIAGHDPGGNNAHGFALLQIKDGKPESIITKTLYTAESVIGELLAHDVIGLGVDTLSCWCTGRSGWRSADLWLRDKYPEVRGSVVNPNNLSGSMALNGMSVLIEARKRWPMVAISETHPKVLYYALVGRKHDYDNNPAHMDDFLSAALNGIELQTSNDHEWDAAISAYATMMGLTGAWENDLHELQAENDCRTVHPCGETYYFWPND